MLRNFPPTVLAATVLNGLINDMLNFDVYAFQVHVDGYYFIGFSEKRIESFLSILNPLL